MRAGIGERGEGEGGGEGGGGGGGGGGRGGGGGGGGRGLDLLANVGESTWSTLFPSCTLLSASSLAICPHLGNERVSFDQSSHSPLSLSNLISLYLSVFPSTCLSLPLSLSPSLWGTLVNR